MIRTCETCGARFETPPSDVGRFCSRPCQHASYRRPRKHGHTLGGVATPEYVSWENMIARCYQPTTVHFERYGGRGIRVHEPWKDFATFLREVGPKPTPKHTLDRYPNRDGNYEPGNVRWATMAEQIENRDATRRFTAGGVTDTLRGWSSRLGVKYCTLATRIDRGWPIERALSAPCHAKGRRT